MSSQKKEENVKEMECINVEEMQCIVAEKILQKRVTHEGKLEYFLKWKSLPDSDNVWIPAEVLGSTELGCPELIETYEDSIMCETSDKKRKLIDTENLSSRYVLKKKACMSSRKKEDNVQETEYIDVEEMEYIVIEKILEKRVTHEGKLEYFLKWKGLPDSDNVWIPAEVLGCPEFGCQELINAYELSFRCEISDKKRKLTDTESLSTRYVLKKKACVEESNDAQMNINSLPQEVLVKIFGYLSHNELGRISRVCKRWHEVTRCPLLWKKVAVRFQKLESENKDTVVFLQNVPSCVTHLKLDYRILELEYRKKCLKFEEFCVMLGEKCPFLKGLLLYNTHLSVSLQSAIDLCRQYLQNLEALSFRFCNFTRHFVKVEYSDFSKIKVLDLQLNDGVGFFSKISLSKMPSLRKLVLFGTYENESWFMNNTSILENLEVLNVPSALRLCSRTFQLLQNRALKLTELHLCRTSIQDDDFCFHKSIFPQLKTICLKRTEVTYEGVVHLIKSCQSLQNIYVNERVAESCALHPFVVANRCKLEIVKTTTTCIKELLSEFDLF